jgi:PAS domain S-box-containing protein
MRVSVRELDELEEYLRRVEPLLSDEDRVYIRNALGHTHDAFNLLESKYLDAIQDRAVVHSLLLKTSEDLVQRYRAIFEYSGTAMVVLERDGTISLANSFFETIFGFSRNNIEGIRKFSEFADTELNNLIGRLLEHVEEEDTRLQQYIEGRVTDIHGQQLVVSVSLGWFPKTGQCLLSIIDITDRKRAEEVIHESEEKYRALFESAGDVIFIHDMDGRILAFNMLACERLGYEERELLSMRVEQVGSPKDARHAPERIARVVEHENLLFETEHRRKDGSLIPTTVSARLITWDGQPAVMSICHDISVRKRAEESLRQANRKLTLLSGITRHDINNQLTVLQGFLAQIQKKQNDPTLNNYFGKVTTAAQRISDMIQFTREYEAIGVNAPVWQDCRTLVDNASKKVHLGGIIVRNDFPAGLELYADQLVAKVFYNLMDNAVRYGGKITTIRFSVCESGDRRDIVCEDDGDGVPGDEKERIFDRGYGKNTGLGLALSREILGITGITISETGIPGEGARFEIAVQKGTWRIADKIG